MPDWTEANSMPENGPSIPDTALYYPFIHFRSEPWLKYAALFWPHISRILPADYKTRDSNVVKALDRELGLIVNVSPEPAVEAVAPVFIEFLTRSNGSLRGEFPVLDNYISHLDIWDGEPGYAQIWGGELSANLAQALIGAGVGAWSRPGSPWLAVHPRLAQVYMSALADSLCDANSMLAVTDSKSAHLTTGPWTVERIAEAVHDKGTPSPHSILPEAGDIISNVIVLTMRTICPKDIDTIPVADIIRARQRAAPLLDDFRQYMATEARQFSSLSRTADRDLLEARIRDVVDTAVKDKMKDLASELRSSGVDVVRNVVSIRTVLPGIAGYVASEVARLPPSFIAGSASAIGIMNVAVEAGSHRSQLVRDSPVGYLYMLNKALLPNRYVWRQFWKRFPFGP